MGIPRRLPPSSWRQGALECPIPAHSSANFREPAKMMDTSG